MRPSLWQSEVATNHSAGGTTMPSVSERPEAPTTIQNRDHLAASFVSLELSRSIWPDRYRCQCRAPARNVEAFRASRGRRGAAGALFGASSGRRRSGPENPFRSSSFRKRVSTASGFIGCCKAKASEAMSSIRRRSRRRADGSATRRV